MFEVGDKVRCTTVVGVPDRNRTKLVAGQTYTVKKFYAEYAWTYRHSAAIEVEENNGVWDASRFEKVAPVPKRFTEEWQNEAELRELVNDVMETAHEHPGDGLQAACAALALATRAVEIYTKDPKK